MFKKRERPTAARKTDDADGDGVQGTVPSFAKKARQSASASASGVNESGSIVASTRKGDADRAADLTRKLEDQAMSGWVANDSASKKPGDDAVRRLEVDTDVSHDTRAVLERNQAIHKGLKDGTLEKGIYRGVGAYKQYAERGEGAIANSKYSGQLGPTRGISNVRSTLRIEYIGTTGEGGICKDYKETGYCGFGDSCKFLHDRSDYKPSYILEKEWEEAQQKIQEKKRLRWEKRLKRRQATGGNPEDDDSADDDKSTSSGSDDELPTACPECHENWENCKSIPIQTVCGHYFCEDCALQNFATSPKCPTCGAPTNGIFNSCDSLEEKIKQKRAAKLAKRQKDSALRDPNRSAYDIGLDKDAKGYVG